MQTIRFRSRTVGRRKGRTAIRTLVTLAVLAGGLLAAGPQVTRANNGPEYVFGPAGTGCICPAAGGLRSVSAISSNDAWAFGFRAPESGLVRVLAEHWNGILWQVVPTPQPADPEGGRALLGSAAISSDNVWAVGARISGETGVGADALIEHWNGHRITVVPTPKKFIAGYNRVLEGVFAVNAHDVWAVGFQGPLAGDGDPGQPLIAHYNGRRWSFVTAPKLNNRGSVLTAVSGSSWNDIWAVGVRDDGNVGTLAMHFNGNIWRIIPTPSAYASDFGLAGVAAVSPWNAWAVGPVGKYNAIEHWNGFQWKTFPSPTPLTVGGALWAVNALSASDIWAVGEESPGQTTLEHFNGSQWSLYPSPILAGKNPVLFGAAVASWNDAWAVGGVFDGTGDPTGALIEHWNGVKWRAIVRP